MIDWRGDEVKKKALAATVMGMKQTMSDCLTTAKDRVHIRTGTLQRSIKMRAPEIRGSDVVGLWGSWDVNYAFWQEVLPLEKGGKPYLRPAADEHYTHLGKNIRRFF